MQLERVIADSYRVTGIIAAGKPRHDISLCRQPICDTAFSFIAPLRSN